ncbi:MULTISPECIES: hypothetical protein [unclassified Blastococcus]
MTAAVVLVVLIAVGLPLLAWWRKDPVLPTPRELGAGPGTGPWCAPTG